MIQITRQGVLIDQTDAERDGLREQFRGRHHVVLPNVIEPRLLDLIRDKVAGAEFYERVDPDIGSNIELCMEQGIASNILHLLFNGSAWIDYIKTITGYKDIVGFAGRVYQFIPGQGHHDSWHNDMVGGRRVAMSLNLGREPFQGGELEMRYTDSQEMIATVHNVGRGDALLFRIDEALEHHVAEVRGEAPRLVFAGWYDIGESYLSLLHQAAQK
jgi:hypothetical protein